MAAPASTAPTPPAQEAALGEPPAPPVPEIRLQGLSSRITKLGGKAGKASRGPHLRDIVPRAAKHGPISGTSPAARRRAIAQETEERAKAQARVTKRLNPQPGPAAMAVGAATGELTRAAIRRRKAKLPAPPVVSQAPAPTRRTVRRNFEEGRDLNTAIERARSAAALVRKRRMDRIKGRIPKAAEEAEHEYVPVRIEHGFPAGPDVIMQPAPGAAEDPKEAEHMRLLAEMSAKAIKERDDPAIQDETTRRVAEAIRADLDRPEKEQEHMEAQRIAEEAARKADKQLQPTQPGPPRASDKTSGEIRADARAIIDQWEHIAANEQLPRSQRLMAQRRADELRRIAEQET